MEKCEYIFPNLVISSCKSLKDIQDYQQNLIKKGKDASRLPDSFHKLNGIYNKWNKSELISKESPFASSLSDDDLNTIKNHNISCYGYFCYSTDIWDKYNDEIMRLRKGTRILQGGLQLATNYMPQGELITIPLKRNIGYQNVTHVLIHIENADPDLGRKGFQPELVELLKNISIDVVKIFLNWRHLLKKETGAPPNIVEEKNIHEWIKQQEHHEVENPLIIDRKDVFLPIMEPSITSKPLYEQDVIALFKQLLAGGVIRGVKIMATSQHKQYDGIVRFYLGEPIENHIFEKKKNPLGVMDDAAKTYTSAPMILEYKYTFDALLEEFEKGEKNEKQIHLVVAWEMGESWQKRYDITPLLYLDNVQHRYFHGCTHLLKNSSTGDLAFPAIILSELINYINNIDSVQEYQKKKYIEELSIKGN